MYFFVYFTPDINTMLNIVDDIFFIHLHVQHCIYIRGYTEEKVHVFALRANKCLVTPSSTENLRLEQRKQK